MGSSDAARIAALNIYPVKSCGGIALDRAELTPTGLKHDREWMVVDEDGRYLTQRGLPRLALIRPVLDDATLELRSPDSGPLRVSLTARGAPAHVRVWADNCAAFDCGDDAAEWLEDFLDRPARLVRYDFRSQRLSDPSYCGGIEAGNAFSDGFPLLIISQASLDDLNDRLAERSEAPLTMNRFRPNIVIDGVHAFEEDYIRALTGEGIELRPVKPCTRCAITTTDQDTAERGVEPLLTLATYRHDDRLDGVAFGQNAIIARGIGRRLAVGGELEIDWNF